MSTRLVARSKKDIFGPRTQFTPKWARKFILGHVLQTFSDKQLNQRKLDRSLVELQSSLASKWRLPVEPVAAVEAREMLRALTRYAVGEGPLLTETVELMTRSLSDLGVRNLQSPTEMNRFLLNLGFYKEGDNPFRIASKVPLQHDPAVPSLVSPHLEPIDPYDIIREDIHENIYAIDSKSTSEVDDAIGLSYDKDGTERITVYVSDATVHCPFDSKLETLTARSMTTTSYLPEGVYFMLPKPIVEAATLREDRKCRTFNINFRMIEATGELHDFRISLGWAHNMKRITYDTVQEVYDSGSLRPTASCPRWCTDEDIKKIHRIHEIAKIRMGARKKRVESRTGRPSIDSGVPDPLIKVEHMKVVSVEDQILGTKDARIAVAELMIAANETCSRVAQARKVSLPFRGTRPLSSDHLANLEEVARPGVISFPQLTDQSLVSRVFDTIDSLSSVSRAIYHHEPIAHVGLDTFDYCHATSPLRRYPDMLVHHQLKVAVAQERGHSFETDIQPFHMAELTALCSEKQEQAALLQDKSSLYWLLRFIKDSLIGADGQTPLECTVGNTRRVSAAIEEERDINGACFAYCSDVYLPRLQMVHSLYHNDGELQAGWTVFCRAGKCDPLSGLLELVPVRKEFRENSLRDFIEKALVPSTLTS